jgi:hypothetical protein
LEHRRGRGVNLQTKLEFGAEGLHDVVAYFLLCRVRPKYHNNISIVAESIEGDIKLSYLPIYLRPDQFRHCHCKCIAIEY